jgi:hypothetical protein
LARRCGAGLGEVEAAIRREPQAQLDAVLLLDDIEPHNLVLRGDDALGQAEADSEVLQVRGRGHHHGMRGAVVDQRHRHLIRHRTRVLGDGRGRHLDTADGDGAFGGYSAAST